MAAHIRSIVRNCRAPGCNKVASHELRNTHNATLATYCARHAEKALEYWNTKRKVYGA